MKQELVNLVALKPLPFGKIFLPGDEFTADKGYADFFVRKGLAKLADNQPSLLTRTLEAASDVVKRKPGRPKGAGKGTYARRDMRAE